MDFLHNNLPDPIMLDLGFVSIHWYGFLVVLATVAGFLVVWYLADKYRLDRDRMFDLVFYLVIFGLVGARVYHVLNEIPYYVQNPSQILAVWNGGLAFHGGLIAGVFVIFVYLKKHKGFGDLFAMKGNNKQNTNSNKKNIKQNLLFLGDIFVPALVIGQAIGRWGNYFNQELYGGPTSLAWGIPIALENRMAGYERFIHFHPTFLYESVTLIVLFVILFLLHKIRLKRIGNQIKLQVKSYKLKVTSSGFIFSIYLISASLIRILMEFVRIDKTPEILGVRLPILVGCVFMVAGLILIFYISNFMRVED